MARFNVGDLYAFGRNMEFPTDPPTLTVEEIVHVINNPAEAKKKLCTQYDRHKKGERLEVVDISKEGTRTILGFKLLDGKYKGQFFCVAADGEQALSAELVHCGLIRFVGSDEDLKKAREMDVKEVRAMLS